MKISSSALKLKSLNYGDSYDLNIQFYVLTPLLQMKRKHKSIQFECNDELWQIWLYLHHPNSDTKERNINGYLSIYLELINKHKKHDFWANIRIEVNIDHPQDPLENIHKISLMNITRYNVSRGFQSILKWNNIKKFLLNGNIVVTLHLVIRTRDLYDNLIKQSPLMYSDRPYVLKAEWSDLEINNIHLIAKVASTKKYQARLMRRDFGSDSKRYGNTNGHKAIYIQDAIFDLGPKIHKKIMKLLYKNIYRWTYRSKELICNIKRIEYIIYNSPKSNSKELGDWIGWHTDQNSIMACSIMLSSSSNYSGGIYQARQINIKDYVLEKGDMIFFPGNILEHRVTPITKGKRIVLIAEFWNKEPQTIQCSYVDWDSNSENSN